MNRIEALRILGLDEDATDEDIRIAYKESAQILHPDRFASNKKLQDRATEQFKNLQEAYEYITSGKGKKARNTSGSQTSPHVSYSSSNHIEAQLAGLAAAKTQLIAQRDAVLDERRIGFTMAGVGGVAAIVFRWRIPALLAIATTAVVWGIVRIISAQANLNKLDEHIKKINREQRRLAEELDDLE